MQELENQIKELREQRKELSKLIRRLTVKRNLIKFKNKNKI